MGLFSFLFGKAKPDLRLDSLSMHDPKKDYCPPSSPDVNDYYVPSFELCGADPSLGDVLPGEKVVLADEPPGIRNQQMIGSCASHAVIAAYEHELAKKGCFVEMSELYHYYNARKSLGKECSNVGMDLRTACSILKSEGLCFEKFWPYVPLKFKDAPGPSAFFCNKTLNKMGKFSVKAYFLADSFDDARTWMRKGFWVVAGIRMFPKFNSAYGKDFLGIDSIKNINVNLYGGHGVNLVGFDDSKKRVMIRNSWGSFWGKNGYCWLDYELFEKICFEMRVITV